MLVHCWYTKASQSLKSTHLEIQDGGQPPNFQSLNGYNSGVHWSISLKFSTEFQHVTADTWFKVKGSKVKVTAYVTANTVSRQICVCFFTYLLRENVTIASGSGHRNVGHAVTRSSQSVSKKRDYLPWIYVHANPRGGWQAHFAKRPKTIFSNQTNPKTQNVWRDVVRPSRCNAFAIARFLVMVYSVVEVLTVFGATCDRQAWSVSNRRGVPRRSWTRHGRQNCVRARLVVVCRQPPRSSTCQQWRHLSLDYQPSTCACQLVWAPSHRSARWTLDTLHLRVHV